MLITAGRDALAVNPKFRAFLTSLGRTPPSPIERPPATPRLPLPPQGAANPRADIGAAALAGASGLKNPPPRPRSRIAPQPS